MASAEDPVDLEVLQAGRWVLYHPCFLPPRDLIQKAKEGIRQKFANDVPRLRSISATQLYAELKEQRHGRAAVQFALYDLVMAELLQVMPPRGLKLEDDPGPDYKLAALDVPGDWSEDQLNKTFTRGGKLDTTVIISSDKDQASRRKRGTKKTKTRKIDVAITLICRNPELDDAEIARQTHCDRSYLTKSKEYQNHADMARLAAARQQKQAVYDARSGQLHPTINDPS